MDTLAGTRRRRDGAQEIGWIRDGAVTAAMASVGVALWLDAGAQTVLAVLLLTTALTAATWSPAAAVGTCLLTVPTVFHLHDLPWGRFSLLELAILVAAGGYFLRRLVDDGWRGAIEDVRTLVRPIEIELPVLALVAVAAASLTSVALPEFWRESIREVRLVIIGPIVFFCIARLTWRDRRARLWSAFCLLGAGSTVALIAVGQAALGLGGVDTGLLTRATVSYPHPNNLALFLERSTLFSAGGLLAAPRSLWLWVLVSVQVAGLLATFSRGAILALLAGAAVLLWWRGLGKGLRAVGMASGVVVLFLLIFARDRLLDVGGAGEEPTRFAIWRSSIRMAQDFPVTGIGPDQFLYLYGRRYVEPAAWPERYTAHPHNLVLDIWLRLGVAGLAVATWLAAGIAREVWRIRRSGAKNVLAPGALAALAGGLAHGLVDNGFFLPDLAVLTWACVAWLITARTVAS